MLSMSQQELSYYSFNDKRLVKRFSSIMEQLLSAAAKSFPAIFTDKAALKGFYRFISNREVTETGLLAAHSCYTAKQVEEKNSRRVYLLQDTTSLDTNRYAKQGVGYLHKQHSKGLWLHHSLLLDEQFMPLGLLESQMIIRERADYGKKYSRKQTKPEEKESYKWIAGIQRATCLQAMEVVHVADRESDMAAFMQAILDEKQQFVIRSAQNRRLSGEQVKLREKLQASPQMGLVRQLTNKQGKCYQATCSLSYAQVSLANKQAAIVLQAVYLREQAGDTEWLLLTNLPVSNCAQAIAILDIYQQRWVVEEYHKCLKTGCQLEQRQVNEADNFYSMIALLQITAVKLLQIKKMTYQPSAQESIALEILAENHLTKVEKQQLSKGSRLWLLVLIARLGGHQGIKQKGMPGWQTLWKGWQFLQLYLQGFAAARAFADS